MLMYLKSICSVCGVSNSFELIFGKNDLKINYIIKGKKRLEKLGARQSLIQSQLLDGIKQFLRSNNMVSKIASNLDTCSLNLEETLIVFPESSIKKE